MTNGHLIEMRDGRKRLRFFLSRYNATVLERERLEAQKSKIERDYISSRGDIVGISMITADIQKHIDKEIRCNALLLAQIKDILSYLPDNSTQRKVLDARYIDRMNWVQIERHFNYSSATVKRYAARGLDELLKFERVRELIKNT